MVKTQISILYFYGRLFGIFLLLINSLLLANDRRFATPLPHKESLIYLSDSLSVSALSKKSDTIYIVENTLIYDSELTSSSKDTPVKFVQIQKQKIKLKKTSGEKTSKKKSRKKKQIKTPVHKCTVSVQHAPAKTSISSTWDNVVKTFITSSNPDKKAAALKSNSVSVINKNLIYLIIFFIDYSFPFIISIFFIASYRLRPPPEKNIQNDILIH